MNEEDVLTNRQLGFELKAANNMIRRKMEVIFAQQDSHELNGMQGPLLGYLYHKSRNGDVYQKDVEREFQPGAGGWYYRRRETDILNYFR